MFTPSSPQPFPPNLHEYEGIPIAHDEPTPEQKIFFHALIPFAAHLFEDSERSPRLFGASTLPLKEEHIASREALQALHDILLRGSLKLLCHQTGWQMRDVAQHGAEKPHHTRLWDAPHWHAHPLAFSDISIDTLIVLFNLLHLYPPARKRETNETSTTPTRKAQTTFHDPHPPKQDKASKIELLSAQRRRRVLEAQWRHLSSLFPRKNGDILLHFFFHDYVQKHLPRECATHPAWRNNPLILLAFFDEDQRIKEQGLDVLQSLLDPCIAPLLPWLGVHLRGVWMENRAQHIDSPKFEDFLHYFEQMTRVWGGAIRTFRQAERYDLLVPWLEIFSVWLAQDEITVRWPRWLHHVSYPQRMNDRQAITDGFLQSIGLIAQLQDIAEEIRALHPTEREATHKLFLKSYADTGFSEVFQAQKELKRTLQPTLS